MPIALHTETSRPLDEAEILREARAMNLAPGGGAGQAQLMAALYRPGIELTEMTRLIAGEPALALRTLKVANSAYYRRCGEVGTVDRAVQVLGATAVKGIAAAACLDRLVSHNPGLAASEAARLRRHSIAVAMCAQALARRCARALEAEAFMAGVLHEVGVLVLWTLRPDTMARLAQGQADAPELGVSHGRAGQLVMQAWQLPLWLQLTVDSHHAGQDDQPWPEGMAGELCAITRLADVLARRLGFGQASSPDGDDNGPALQRCGLAEDDLDALSVGLVEDIESFIAAVSA